MLLPLYSLAAFNTYQHLSSCKECCNHCFVSLSLYPTQASEGFHLCFIPHPNPATLPFFLLLHLPGRGRLVMGQMSRTIWRIYDMLLAATSHFTVPFLDRCSHSLWRAVPFMSQIHNNAQFATRLMMLYHEQNHRLPNKS